MEHFSLWSYLDFFPGITKYMYCMDKVFCIITNQHVVFFLDNFLFDNFIYSLSWQQVSKLKKYTWADNSDCSVVRGIARLASHRLTRSRGPRHLLPGFMYFMYSVCLCPYLLGCAVEVIVNLCLSKICNKMQFKIDLFKILNCCHCFQVNQKLHTTVRRIVVSKYTYLCFTEQARTEVTCGFLLRYELNISPVKNKIFIFLDRNFPAKSKSGQSGFIQLVSL
jgi:hypothetical protein